MTNLVVFHENSGNGEFTAVPGLFNPDGDINLIFLSSNGIEFYEKTSDLWYRATAPGDEVHSTFVDAGKTEVYQPEEAASPMGCVRQFQFCNPSLLSNNCGPLASWDDAQIEASPLFGIPIEEMQSEGLPTTTSTMGSRYLWLIQVLSVSQADIGAIIMALGPDALTSLKYLSSGIMGPLPTNQWQLDVRYWWATFLASLQAAVVNTAHGPTDPTLDPYKVLPFNSHAQDMCNSQVRYLSMHSCSFKLTQSAQNFVEDPQ